MPDIFVSTKDKTQTPVIPSVPVKTSFPAHLFSSYLFMPEDVRFETQDPGETIILLLRKHWITNLGWIIASAVLIVFPLLLFPSLAIIGIIPANSPIAIITLIIFSWYLLTFSYILINFLLWYFTVGIVTQERIIDIEFVNLLNKKFSETMISKIEDVTMQTGGFIRSFVDFGDVYVQTAGTELMFHYLDVPHPDDIVRIINQLMDKLSDKGGH